MFHSIKGRLFLTAWVVYSVHFATNVMREHYPALSLVENGTFQVDRYLGLHSDIFLHTDGHSYIGNNVDTSVVAAVPLLAFRPMLDALEEHSKKKLAESDAPGGVYRTEGRHPNSEKMFRMAKEQGLELRLGAAAMI